MWGDMSLWNVQGPLLHSGVNIVQRILTVDYTFKCVCECVGVCVQVCAYVRMHEYMRACMRVCVFFRTSCIEINN